MTLSVRPACRPALRARLEFARTLEASEEEVAARVRAIERDPLFVRLLQAGAIAIDPYASSRFAARRLAGRELRGGAGEAPELLDGQGDVIRLVKAVGQDLFEKEFLGSRRSSDQDCAARCAISEDEVRRLREFVDRLYIQEELSPRGEAADRVFSSIGSISIENGQPMIAFFNREIWKGRYRINAGRSDAALQGIPPAEARRARALISEVALIDRRKSTLYQVLEIILEVQADYLVSGDPDRRRPLPQRVLASRVGVCPSVVNRLVSNKAVELPWGAEVPLKALLPSRKAVLRDQLYQLAIAQPELTDNRLSDELFRRFGVRLSRYSIVEYRRECRLTRRTANSTELVPA